MLPASFLSVVLPNPGRYATHKIARRRSNGPNSGITTIVMYTLTSLGWKGTYLPMRCAHIGAMMICRVFPLTWLIPQRAQGKRKNEKRASISARFRHQPYIHYCFFSPKCDHKSGQANKPRHLGMGVSVSVCQMRHT